MDSKQKTSAKRKSVQENDYGKSMILSELQLTEQLDQKLKQYSIETHKLTKNIKGVVPSCKRKGAKTLQTRSYTSCI